MTDFLCILLFLYALGQLNDCLPFPSYVRKQCRYTSRPMSWPEIPNHLLCRIKCLFMYITIAICFRPINDCFAVPLPYQELILKPTNEVAGNTSIRKPANEVAGNTSISVNTQRAASYADAANRAGQSKGALSYKSHVQNIVHFLICHFQKPIGRWIIHATFSDLSEYI